MTTFRSALLAAAVLAAAPVLAQPPQGRGEWRSRSDAAQTGTSSPGRSNDGDFGGRRGFQSDRTQGADTTTRGFGRDRSSDNARAGQTITPDAAQTRVLDQDRSNQDRSATTRSRFDESRRDDSRFGNDRRDDNRFGDSRRGDSGLDRDRDRFGGGRNDGRRYGNDNRYDRGQFNRFGGGSNGWRNDWRSDRRYDWRGFRDNNRNLFRGPRYVAPRGWSYGYRSFSRGYRLSPFLYSSSYWLADPYSYRLPPAYGPYRWVRYYDDVLLVDITTGIVVDVIQSFFW